MIRLPLYRRLLPLRHTSAALSLLSPWSRTVVAMTQPKKSPRKSKGEVNTEPIERPQRSTRASKKQEQPAVVEAAAAAEEPRKKKAKLAAKGEAEAPAATATSSSSSAVPEASTSAAAVESLSAPVPKSKTDYEAAEGIPRNLTIPDPLVLAPKPEGTTRIASWNILSLKSAMPKGLMRYVDAEDADVLFFSETKCNDVPMVPGLTAKYPHQTWGIGATKGYAGVALLSKVKPLKVTVGFAGDNEANGRLITAEYERYIVCGTYVVNAGEGLKSMPAKVKWNEQFAQHLAQCDKRKPTIWTGDLNVVLDARDLSKASQKWNKSPGYTAIECNHHRSILSGTAVEPKANEYVDIWRERNPDAIGHFSFYGFRGFCRTKGIGWRLDTFIVPKRIAEEVVDVGIRHSVYGASDHVPVYMDIKGSL